MDYDQKDDVMKMIKNFEQCKTIDHLMKENKVDIGSNYIPIIGDPCYRYRREVKEAFF